MRDAPGQSRPSWSIPFDGYTSVNRPLPDTYPDPSAPQFQKVSRGERAVEWRPVAGSPGYEVSSDGDVRHRGRILVKRPHPRGYHIVDVSVDGRATSKTVHRLVAIAFKGDPLGRQVNHLNGVKTDNRDTNLEWCSPAENMRHAHALRRAAAEGRAA